MTRVIFVLCHHTIVNLFVSKPELNGANLPNLDLNSCHFCPSYFCLPTVKQALYISNPTLEFLRWMSFCQSFLLCVTFEF
jgi:hypothetical protein